VTYVWHKYVFYFQVSDVVSFIRITIETYSDSLRPRDFFLSRFYIHGLFLIIYNTRIASYATGRRVIVLLRRETTEQYSFR